MFFPPPIVPITGFEAEVLAQPVPPLPDEWLAVDEHERWSIMVRD
jgi:hypothetical protein